MFEIVFACRDLFSRCIHIQLITMSRQTDDRGIFYLIRFDSKELLLLASQCNECQMGPAFVNLRDKTTKLNVWPCVLVPTRCARPPAILWLWKALELRVFRALHGAQQTGPYIKYFFQTSMKFYLFVRFSIRCLFSACLFWNRIIYNGVGIIIDRWCLYYFLIYW